MGNRTSERSSIHNLGDVKMKQVENEYSNIHERVSFYIDGKHGKIGVIIPERNQTEEEWKKFNEDIADIIFKANMLKVKAGATAK